MTGAASGSDQGAEAQRRRQAPRWGEYATPEEVAALRGPDAAPAAPVAPPPPIGRPLPGPPPEGQIRRPSWDAFLTLGLLAFGAVNVLDSVVGYLDLRATLAQWFELVGKGSVDLPASLAPWGYVFAAVDVVLYVAAVGISLRRLRHGRLAFWVPIVAAVAATVLDAILLLVALASTGSLGILQNQG